MAAAAAPPVGVKLILLMARNVLLIISTELLQLLAKARRHGEACRKALTAPVLQSTLPTVWVLQHLGH